MPRLNNFVPKYRKHKQSGQAIVTLSGRDFLLGPHGSKASRIEYDRRIAEWLQNGRQLQPDMRGSGLTVVELIAAYLHFAKRYYRKDGRITSEYDSNVSALRPVKLLYGRKPAAEFGPVALQVVMQRMVDEGWTRGTVNKQAGRIKRMFKWGVSRQLVPGEIAQSLWSVDGLRKGRTEARESTPVLPVEEATIDTTIAYLPPVVADMVRVQRLTGMRPAELCMIRPCDIDRTVDPWRYVPETHKTEHHGRERTIFIGPLAQAILLRYLARGDEDCCFQPRDSEAKRRAVQHAARVVPFRYGNRPGTNRKPRPRRTAGNRYTVASYRRAIRRACDNAFPAPHDVAADPTKVTAWQSEHRWSPNQLRHSAATDVRRRYGLEAAQVLLGHSSADVTQVYAERDYALAARVAKEVG